jgi:Delta7-sterol 5-desaturase
MRMLELLHGRVPNLLEVTAGTAVGLGMRYAMMAGLAWLLAYVWLKQRWLHRKIVMRFPASTEVRREMLYSALSVVIFTVVAAGTIAAANQGWNQIYWRVSDYGWAWFWGSIVCTIFLHDAYFYWTHRLMHHPRLFPYFHRVHHLSHNPSPWAAYAFDPLEAFVQAGIFPLAALVMPIHPIAFAIFMGWQITNNVLGHTGFEFYPRRLMTSPIRYFLNTPTNHAMHHEKMRGNYGLYFNFWDRLMHTNHSDYERRFLEVTNRSRQHTPSTANLRHEH